MARRMRELDCPPREFDIDCHLPADATILDYAANATAAANAYRAAIDARVDFYETMRRGRALAIATQALTTAIADAVACGDNRLS